MWVQAMDSVDTTPRLIFDHPHKTPGERLFSYPLLQMGKPTGSLTASLDPTPQHQVNDKLDSHSGRGPPPHPHPTSPHGAAASSLPMPKLA